MSEYYPLKQLADIHFEMSNKRCMRILNVIQHLPKQMGYVAQIKQILAEPISDKNKVVLGLLHRMRDKGILSVYGDFLDHRKVYYYIGLTGPLREYVIDCVNKWKEFCVEFTLDINNIEEVLNGRK